MRQVGKKDKIRVNPTIGRGGSGESAAALFVQGYHDYERRHGMKSVDEIKKTLQERRAVLREQYKVKEIGIFGSYVKGEQAERSDVDILVGEDMGTPSCLTAQSIVPKYQDDSAARPRFSYGANPEPEARANPLAIPLKKLSFSGTLISH